MLSGNLLEIIISPLYVLVLGSIYCVNIFLCISYLIFKYLEMCKMLVWGSKLRVEFADDRCVLKKDEMAAQKTQ